MINNVVIIGAGTMGQGIIKLLNHFNVGAAIFGSRNFLSEDFLELDKIRSAELIIEAGAENYLAKSDILSKISATNSSGIIASNTSSLSILELSNFVCDSTRFCGIHFMNPAPHIPIVEFTTNPNFSAFRKAEVLDLLNSINRVVYETLDQPGFVLNAILFPFLNRAIYMLENSNMTPTEIDQIMISVCGHKIGPLATLDLIGLDVSLEILNILHSRDSFFNLPPSKLLVDLVSKNRLGKKTRSGFFEY